MALEPTPISADPPPLNRRTVLRQRWAELAYFHWRYDPAVVRATLPEGLTVDTFDGSAWVGLIPFEMQNVRVGPIPAPPPLANFIEINVRTYVFDNQGRRAVWFYSLDVPRSMIVAVARTVFALPYQWAGAGHEIEGARHRYHLNRRARPGRTGPTADLQFTVGESLDLDDVSDLDHFLTARWALATQRRTRLLHGRVSHPRWPLHRVDHVDITQNVVEAAGLPTPTGEPHSLYSPGVNVELAWLERSSVDADGNGSHPRVRGLLRP